MLHVCIAVSVLMSAWREHWCKSDQNDQILLVLSDHSDAAEPELSSLFYLLRAVFPAKIQGLHYPQCNATTYSQYSPVRDSSVLC